MQYFDKISEILKIFIEDIDRCIEECYILDTTKELYNELMSYAEKSIESIYEERFMISLLLDTIFKNKTYSYNFIFKINKIQKNKVS